MRGSSYCNKWQAYCTKACNQIVAHDHMSDVQLPFESCAFADHARFVLLDAQLRYGGSFYVLGFSPCLQSQNYLCSHSHFKSNQNAAILWFNSFKDKANCCAIKELLCERSVVSVSMWVFNCSNKWYQHFLRIRGIIYILIKNVFMEAYTERQAFPPVKRVSPSCTPLKNVSLHPRFWFVNRLKRMCHRMHNKIQTIYYTARLNTLFWLVHSCDTLLIQT